MESHLHIPRTGMSPQAPIGGWQGRARSVLRGLQFFDGPGRNDAAQRETDGTPMANGRAENA